SPLLVKHFVEQLEENLCVMRQGVACRDIETVIRFHLNAPARRIAVRRDGDNAFATCPDLAARVVAACLALTPKRINSFKADPQSIPVSPRPMFAVALRSDDLLLAHMRNAAQRAH